MADSRSTLVLCLCCAVHCEVRKQIEERAFIIESEFVLFEVGAETKETIEGRTYNTTQHNTAHNATQHKLLFFSSESKEMNDESCRGIARELSSQTFYMPSGRREMF